jgi:hypothetical protein
MAQRVTYRLQFVKGTGLFSSSDILKGRSGQRFASRSGLSAFGTDADSRTIRAGVSLPGSQRARLDNGRGPLQV